MDTELEVLQDLLKKSIGGTAPIEDSGPDLDWAKIFSIAHQIQPLPTFARQLLRIPHAPAAQRKQLEDFLHGSRRRSGLLMLELVRLIPALEEAGCSPMVLKGPALAQTVYDSPEDRFFSDLDILIPAEQWVTASRTLSSFGYAPSKTDRREEYHARNHFHRRLVNKIGIRVELHWDLSRPAGYYRFDLESLYAASRTITAGGALIRVPSDNHQLLHAAAAGVADGFRDLRRIEDAAYLFKNGSLDLTTLVPAAREQGLETLLWCLLITLREMSTVPVPQDLTDALAPDRFRQKCLLSLALGEADIDRSRHRPAGFGALVYWLCCPEAGTSHAKLLTYVFPNNERLLELGYTPDSMPTRLARIWTSIRTTVTVLKLTGYQGWRLLVHRPGP